VLIPVIKKKGLEIVEPVNTEVDPVNIPGEFIVSNPDNNDCGSQFYLEADEGKTHHIVVSTWGDTEYYDGAIYGHAAYSHGMLSHAESTDNFGYDFPANEPEAAVEFVYETTAHKCPVIGPPQP
jgi:hypothetical protein